ncbi:MAG: hypothetical protein APF81_17745 [Desulfosporosinus sp. BRH_c37]|nr:MAG: hypothetical protein APF81_17745 [Desulfosporosinus sp. BRH_c37]
MALQKEITLDIGLETTAYFKIDAINLDYKNKQFTISLNTYLNKKARDDNKQALTTKHYDAHSDKELVPPNHPSTNFDDYFSCSIMDKEGNVISQAYKFLKKLNEFEGCEDV